MNRTRAKLILGSCLRGGSRPDDSQYREAAEFAESDPELRRWVAETEEFDAIIAAKLREVAPPADLLDTILIGCQHEVRPRGWIWHQKLRSWGAIAAAAALILIAGIPIYLGFLRERSDAAGFRSAASRFLSKDWDHQFTAALNRYPEIREWAAALPQATRLEIPESLSQLRTFGCRVFQWRGHEAILICFISKSNGEMIHVVSISKLGIPNGPLNLSRQSLEMASVGEWNTASWVRGDRFYVAYSKLEPAVLTRELGPINL